MPYSIAIYILIYILIYINSSRSDLGRSLGGVPTDRPSFSVEICGAAAMEFRAALDHHDVKSWTTEPQPYGLRLEHRALK